MQMQMRSNRWVILILCWLTWGFIFADRLLITYVAPGVIKEFKLSMTQFGLTMSMVTITWAIMNALGGNLADRIGRVKVLVPAIFWFSLTTWITGVARSFNQLLFARGLVGVGEGCYWGSGIALIDSAWPPERRGFALGIHQTAAPVVGTFFAGVVAGSLALKWGWRSPFYAFGVAGLIIGILFWWLIKEPKTQTTTKTAETTQQGYKSDDIKKLFSSREWVLNLGVMCVVMITYWAIIAFLPLYLDKVKGLNIAVAGGVTALTGLGGLCGQFFSGLYSDRIGRRPALWIAVLGVVISVPALIFSSSVALIIPEMLVLGYAINAPFPVCIAIIPADISPAALLATSAGITSFISEMAGIAGPILGGYLNDHYGMAAALWLAVVSAIVLAGLVLIMRETAPRITNRNRIAVGSNG